MTPRRLLVLGIAGHLCLLPVAIRHLFFFGAGEVMGISLPDLLGALGVLGLAAFTGLAGYSYLAIARRSEQLPVRWLFGGGCLLTLAALVVPPFLSTDVFDYVAHGRVESVHGANPYVSPPADFPDDPLVGETEWPTFVTPYGPITAYVQHWISWLGGDWIWVGVYGFKLLFAGCHLLASWLIYLALCPGGEAAARRGLQLYLWNPVLLLELAGSAHNEALMAACLAGMCWGIAGNRMGLATAAFGMAVLCKHGCAPLGPCLLALAWRRGQLAGFAKGVAVAAAVTGLLALRYFLEPGALQFLTAQTQNRATSLQHFGVLVLGEGAGNALLYGGYAILLFAVGWSAYRIRNAADFGNRGAVLMLIFLVFAMPLFTPWYHLWWIPLLGIWTWLALDRLLIALAFLAPLSYAVRVLNRSLALDYQIVQWTLALALPLLCIAWYQARRRRRSPNTT